MKAKDLSMRKLIAGARNSPTGLKTERLLVIVILLMGTGIACSPLFAPGWFSGHDFVTHLERIFAVRFEMQQGDFYPRWLSQAAYGKGLPDLNFYSPAWYLVVSWLHFLGIPLAIVLKTSCFGLFFLGAGGMYVWMRRYCDVTGALIAAILYLFTPYHYLDLYVRSAYPEFAALALLPWLFHALDLSFSPKDCVRGIMLTAITSAAIVLTHHLTALMIIPFAMLYFGWHAISLKTNRRKILIAAIGPLLGAGLAAFYWLPMVIEMRYLINFQNMSAIWEHFVYPSQWFRSFWGFGASVPGMNDGMSFQIGAVLVGVGALAFSMFPAVPPDERKFALVLLVLGLFGLFMTTVFSTALYDLFPPMHYFRHPWRFLGPATMFLAAFAGLITRGQPLSRFLWMRWALLGMILVSCIALSVKQRTAIRFPFDLDVNEEKLIESKAIGGAHYDSDFLPKWATFDPDRPINSILWRWQPDKFTTVSGVAVHGATLRFILTSPKPLSITIPWFYFPGWKVAINGMAAPVDIAPGGFITFKVAKGTHTVSLWFGSTWARIAGWAIAGATLLMMGGLSFLRL